MSVDNSTMTRVKYEASKFQDIVMNPYIDNYRNLTKKALGGLSWRSKFCSDPEFHLSVDDDTYVDLEDLVSNHLKRLPDTDFVECSERTVVNGKVWRTGPWGVSETTYSGSKYPNYCNGPCYLMRKGTSQTLYKASQTTVSDLPIDDAYVTGILRSKLQIPLIQVKILVLIKVLDNLKF